MILAYGRSGVKKNPCYDLVNGTINRYNKGIIISTKFRTMTTITLQDIKSHGAKAISDEKAVYLIVNSRTKSVLVPPMQYEMLIAAWEELEDVKAIEERKDEATVPFAKAFPRRKR